MALKTKNRLKKKKEFDGVFKNGKTVNGSFLFIKFKSNNLDVSRFGFVISLKVSKKAVKRNRIRRLLAETAQNNLKQIKDNYDIIIVVKPGMAEKITEKNTIRNDFIKAMVKAQIV